MKRPPSWVSLLLSCTLMVFGAALAFAAIVAGGSVALAGHQRAQAEQGQHLAPATPGAGNGLTFSGMITDSRCGARHLRNSRQNSADCARACVRKGSTYVLVDGDRRYTLIGNDSALAKLAGERANVTGTRQGDSIIVDAASPIF
jgi:hypothetical protein